MLQFSLASLCAVGAGAEGIGSMLGTHRHDHAGLASDAVHSAGFNQDDTPSLERVFNEFEGLPFGEEQLIAQGWTKHTQKCNYHLGYAWTKESTVTIAQPLVMYTSKLGQPSGVGTIITKYLPQEQHIWTWANDLVPVDAGGEVYYHIDLSFRSNNQCDTTPMLEPIGDQLTLNPAGPQAGGESMVIPLFQEGALREDWYPGSCFNAMGTHHFKNTNPSRFGLPMGGTKWDKADFLPLVVMYDLTKDSMPLNAVFFASVTNQYTLSPTGEVLNKNRWEPSPLPDNMMCVNFCDKGCGFTTDKIDTQHSTDVWSTMHIFFNDHNTVSCPATQSCFLPQPYGFGCCDDHSIWKQPGPNNEPGLQGAARDWTWAIVGGAIGVLAGVVGTFVATRKTYSARSAEMTELAA